MTDIHGELFSLAGHWGLGGVLDDLDRILDESNGDISEATHLRRALVRFTQQYAPMTALNASQAWRGDPCDMCANHAETMAEIRATMHAEG